MTTKTEFEALKAEIERQKVQLQALKDRIDPPKREPFQMPRRDLTEGMSMDRETMLAHARAVPGVNQADLAAFQQQMRQRSAPAEPQRPRGSGWVEPRPIESPPGVAIADQLVDAQDRIDKAELVQQLAKTRAIEQASKGEK